MKLKKLNENRHLFSVLVNSKPRLRKAMLKHSIDTDFINLLSKLCLNLAKGNIHSSKSVRQQTK